MTPSRAPAAMATATRAAPAPRVIPCMRTAQKRSAVPADRLAIDLAKHDVERTQDGGNIGQHMTTVEEIHGLQVWIAGSADLAAVRAVAAVRHQVDPEFALGRLHRGVDLSARNVHALGIEFEVMDQRFH